MGEKKTTTTTTNNNNKNPVRHTLPAETSVTKMALTYHTVKAHSSFRYCPIHYLCRVRHGCRTT